MSYFLRYLKHLFTATNQHGVHSPFVYDYVTKCLYMRERNSKKTSVNVFLKSIAYFNVKSLFLPSEATELKEITVQGFPELKFDTIPSDMIFFSASNLKNMEEIVFENEKIHNNTLVFIDNIHTSTTAEMAWQQLKKKDSMTVTIDLFHCGLVFFRKEQAKEHFKIRI